MSRASVSRRVLEGAVVRRASIECTTTEWSDEPGYAMAALLVALGAMAILWAAAIPVWTQAAKREREAELIFRGTQYARAVGLYQRKYGNANPPSLDVLVEQRFLRQQYRDPMVPGGEFELIRLDSGLRGTLEREGRMVTGQLRGTQLGPEGTKRVFERLTQEFEASGRARASFSLESGIVGVRSRSTEASLGVYNGRTRYNEWGFAALPLTRDRQSVLTVIDLLPSGKTPTDTSSR